MSTLEVDISHLDLPSARIVLRVPQEQAVPHYHLLSTLHLPLLLHHDLQGAAQHFRVVSLQFRLGQFKHKLLLVLFLVLEEGPLGEGGAGLAPELLLDFFPHLPEGVHLEALDLPALDFVLELLGIFKDEHKLLVPELDVGALGGGRRT